MPSAALSLRVDGVPLREAYGRARQPVPVPSEPLPISLTIGATPPDGVANHLRDHPVPVIADRHLVRLDLRLVRRLEAEADRDCIRGRLDRVVDQLGKRPGRVLV